jgi:deoxyribose-phosphate aldolase
LLQAAEACHKEGALLTVVFENAYLTDELKIIACRLAERAEVDILKTSTGFAPAGYSVDDVRLMRKYLPEETGIEAGPDLQTVEQVLEVHAAGCTRFCTSAAAAILEEWKGRGKEGFSRPGLAG